MKNETARREIESLDYYLQNHTNDYSEESHTAMMMAIDALSSSEKPNKWIPVSERLPEDSGYYLTTTMYGEVYCDYWTESSFDRHEAIIAWMPLPEPYKAEEREQIPDLKVTADGSHQKLNKIESEDNKRHE